MLLSWMVAEKVAIGYKDDSCWNDWKQLNLSRSTGGANLTGAAAHWGRHNNRVCGIHYCAEEIEAESTVFHM